MKPTIECNVCGWTGLKYSGDRWHKGTICPNCGSEVRHRLLWAALNFDAVLKEKKVLHFAPDKMLRDKIKNLSKEYYSADFLADGYVYNAIDFRLDISDMTTVADKTYDTVIALDVLEHVQNDLKAMREVLRVLKPDGICIFTVPQKDGLETTYEDISISDPKEKERLFGQKDHVRMYGNDFRKKMETAGFEVTVIDEKNFSPSQVKKWVLAPPILSSHPLATNYRKIFFGRKVGR